MSTARYSPISVSVNEDGLTVRLRVGDTLNVIEGDARYFEGKKWFWISRVLVHPSVRRKGVGTAMMKALCAKLDELQATGYLIASPYPCSGFPKTKLAAWYRKFGFIEAPDPFDGDVTVQIRRPSFVIKAAKQ